MQQRSRTYKTAYPGRAGLAVRDDERILAIAGWDGAVRVHSAKTFKPLAVLEYHRESVFAVAFASTRNYAKEGEGKAYETSRAPKYQTRELRRRRAWLAAAGKDERISLWELYPPQDTQETGSNS